MNRLNINLSDRQIKVLTQHADKAGISVAEFIRRILDEIFFPTPPVLKYTATLVKEEKKQTRR
ncbi:MAG: ribbon-helix-helix protein, CopG family [Terriglobales bacterium]